MRRLLTILLLVIVFQSCSYTKENTFFDVPGANFSVSLNPAKNDKSELLILFDNVRRPDTLTLIHRRMPDDYVEIIGGYYIYIISDSEWLIMPDENTELEQIHYSGSNIDIDWRDRTWNFSLFHETIIDYFGKVIPELTENDIYFKSIIYVSGNSISFQPNAQTLPYTVYRSSWKRNMRTGNPRLLDCKQYAKKGMKFELLEDHNYYYLIVKDNKGTQLDMMKWRFPYNSIHFVYQNGVFYVESGPEPHNQFMEHNGIHQISYVPTSKWPYSDKGHKDNTPPWNTVQEKIEFHIYEGEIIFPGNM